MWVISLYYSPEFTKQVAVHNPNEMVRRLINSASYRRRRLSFKVLILTFFRIIALTR